MNGCKVNNVQDYIDDIVGICDKSSQLDLDQGFHYIKKHVFDLIKNARTTSEPKSQLRMIKEALDVFYNSPKDAYGQYLSLMFPLAESSLLFNSNYNDIADVVPPSGGTTNAVRELRQRRFLENKFKDAPNAKLYFVRSVSRDMVETFLVKRASESPKYFSSQEEMNKNVQTYKQELLDRVFAYFDSNALLKTQVSGLNRTMYKDGIYTGVVEQIKGVVDTKLSPEIISSSKKRLDDVYKDYRDINSSTQTISEKLLDAYNAWIILQNFDTVVSEYFGTIVKVHEQDVNGHSGDLHKYEIKGKATNMWSTWLDSDDIADMSEVVSDVTQKLIETSYMYKWGNSEPYKDRYLSFNDFNRAIGVIKKQAFDNISNTIEIHNLKDIDKVSPYTKRILLETLSWNRLNGNVEISEDGVSIPKAVTWKQLIARLNENSQKYLHALFDILCTTDLLNYYTLDEYTKNLIWSFNKEVFGGNGNPRSLFRMHNLARQDSIYPILTQVAASTFPEEYLQYYEKLDGSYGTRLLQDYTIENIRRELAQEIQQVSSTLTIDDYRKYGVTYKSRIDNPIYLQEIDINIPINDKLTFSVKATSDSVFLNKYTEEEVDLIWNNANVHKAFKAILGIDLERDPNFKSAYIEETTSSLGALNDLSNLLGRAVFSGIVNNEYAVKYPKATTSKAALSTFIERQFGRDKKTHYIKKLDKTTGLISVIPVNMESALLKHLAQAKAINGNLLAAAQSTTGEGTTLANYTLSRLRNCFQNQIAMQCKRAASAVKDLTFVINSTNVFEGILTRRELKTINSNQQSTKFSDRQSMQLAFISDFVGGLIPDQDINSYIKNGRVSFLPTVNSDKPQIDGLLVNLYAKTRIPNGMGGYKMYVELTDSEIEQEMISEFKPMYSRIIDNINIELSRLCDLLPLSDFDESAIYGSTSVIGKHHAILNAINNIFKDDTSLGSNSQERIINGLHQVVTKYNSTHTRKPIMLAENVHYVFDSNGLLTSNKTLEVLWGRFNPNISEEDRGYLSSLYAKEKEYIKYLQRNGLLKNGIPDVTSASAFFKYQEHQTIKDLLKMKFSICLNGSDAMVRSNQAEIQFLKGQANFTDNQLKDPHYQHLIALNSEMRNWVNEDGLMVLAKGYVDGKLIEITNSRNLEIGEYPAHPEWKTTLDVLDNMINLQVHPLLSKLNRLDYLCTQQYTVSTVGSHYVHKGKGAEGSVIAEEAQRWLASNKRNVAATSTVHLFQNKQLDGAPSTLNIAIIEDIKADLYTIMGELYLEGHAPLDGGMFDNIWLSYLENNSLCGESVGVDKKPFGTFYDERYAAGGIVKTAGFPPTNVRMRREKAWVNLQKNMSSRKWTKEHVDSDGKDILEVLDITKNYLGETIDYKQAIKGQEIMYKRIAHDNPDMMAAYKLLGIESLGQNQYKIKEVEINAEGVETGNINVRTELIDNNWDLFTKVFGGYYSLEMGSDNKITWSENSNLLMVHAINNVGYRKNNDHLFDDYYGEFGENAIEEVKSVIKSETGLDQDDIWQPLKYSDIHCVPNIGAIKSLQFNTNPDGRAVLDQETVLNFMTMRMAQFGIQLDKEHYADMSEVSMPTQIIQAMANKSYTSEYAKEAYEALSILTRQAIEPYLNGINKIITSKDQSGTEEGKSILAEEVTQLILDNLLKQSGEDTSVNAILDELIKKVEKGQKLKYAEDIEGKFPLSDPTIYNKIFSLISTTLTNVAVKMKFPGSLSVICPTDGLEKLYGDKILSSFAPVLAKDGSTRTVLPSTALITYQQSVIEGKETDSNGRNLLVYDSRRDVFNPPPQEENESVERYEKRIKRDAVRQKLSKVSELKTQHNYIIEFSDESKENVTINTPQDYFRVKNLVVFGKRNPNLDVSNLPVPMNYDEVYYRHLQELENTIDIYDTKEGIVASYLSVPVLTQESVKKELGYSSDEIKGLFGLFKSKAKGGVSIERLAEQIYGTHSEKFEDDYEVRNLIIAAISSARTTKDLKSYGRIALERMAQERTEHDFEMYERYLITTQGKYADEYEQWYAKQVRPVTITKIYENVEEGRSLGAYNVRFTDRSSNMRFQIYDLDSINLLFKLNGLITDSKKKVKGYELFTKLDSDKQQQVLTPIFNSPVFNKNVIHGRMREKYPDLPTLDNNFVENVNRIYPGKLVEIIDLLHSIIKPSAYRRMQKDLFKLSDNFKGDDRRVYANGRIIDPVEIQTEAYELIMPQVYKTQFGLQENDDLQEILRDKDFFIKRGLERFKCKLNHSEYDYELKNFNGDHFYILDRKQGVPEHIQKNIGSIVVKTRKGKLYRTNTNDEIMYELSSEEDRVCKLGNAQIIITDNPEFYIQTLNYNTLKTSPERVTNESYNNLLQHLEQSKRTNNINFLKAITKPSGEYLSLKEFKELNLAIDDLNYDNVTYLPSFKDFKSVAQICRLIIQNGRELHTAFDESLNVIAGRIPAQSQQSFMTQRVVAFDSSELNTAMVSTFQLFLQGSDLDIDAVTLLGYEFDKNGKFIGWSPYFDSTSSEKLKVSKKIPLPTGQVKEIEASKNAKTNFFEIYDKYFGTLFTTIKLPSGLNKTINGVLELQLNVNTPENIELLAQFLRDFKKYGISLKAPLKKTKRGVLVDTSDENFFTAPEHISEEGVLTTEWNLFRHRENGGKIGIRPDQVYAVAQQILKFANDHNNYLNTAEEHLKMKMAKNYVVNYIYKVAESPSNQTEAMDSVDKATRILKGGAKMYALQSGENSHAPGRVSSKVKMIGEGQAGKSGVGIGAVGIKANSTTQFYLSELWNYGDEWDKEKILFKRNYDIAGKSYIGFANMYTTAEFTDEDRKNFSQAMSLLNELESDDQVTLDVAKEIAAMLSISVDNAKDLALAKINSGPKMMGMYVYGMTLGIPTQTLIEIMKSEEGMILAEMVEGSHFSNDTNAFRVLDVFSKLSGNIGRDLDKFKYTYKNNSGYPVKYTSKIQIKGKNFVIKTTHDALFVSMYNNYLDWYSKNENKLPKYKNKIPDPATDLLGMLRQLIQMNAFGLVYTKSVEANLNKFIDTTYKDNLEVKENWIAAKNQMISFIRDISYKAAKMRSLRGQELKILAEGAEEMRVLGSILSINKGLKPTVSEAETFIDTIENLIIDRKKILGWSTSDKDRIDFRLFVLDESYQREVIEAYEKVKHSVNIPHLLSKAPHFKGYLKTQVIPLEFFMQFSIKYRTIHKYRKMNFKDLPDADMKSLFNFFEVEGTKDKEAILKGLENAIQHKLFTNWVSEKQFKLQVPKGFKYFTDRNSLIPASENGKIISLNSEAGLATLKKYMEEIYIPMLQNNSSLSQNEFVKNLIKISYDKNPAHTTVTTYSLPGDLMAKKGRQAELNSKMIADFQQLSTIEFQPELGIPSLADAFYLYAQYCYNGKKGKSSLMVLFDSVNSRSTLAKDFGYYIAKQDSTGEINLSREELITWCAPVGTQQSSAKWVYNSSKDELGISLRQKVDEVALDEDAAATLQEAKEAALEEGIRLSQPEQYGVYRTEYLSNQYDRITKNYFLVPVDLSIDRDVLPMTIKLFGSDVDIRIKTMEDKVSNIQFSKELHLLIERKIADGTITKFKSVSDFRQDLLSKIALIDIPYKVSLTSETKKEVDFGILQTIIEQHLNC